MRIQKANLSLKLVVVAIFIGTSISLLSSANIGLSYHKIKTEINGRNLQLDICFFLPEKYELIVIDNISDFGIAKNKRLSDLMKSEKYAAGINGGFFHVNEFKPQGLVISNGKPRGHFNPKAWMNGVFYVENEKPTIAHRDKFAGNKNITQLLQTGPILIDNFHAVNSFGPDRRAYRSFIFESNDGQWGFGIISPATLEETGAALSALNIDGLGPIKNAINLDGGPSTGIWINPPHKQTISHQESWPVCNFIGIQKRKTKPKPQ